MSDLIVAAVDGSTEGLDAIALGRALAGALDGSLALVGVYWPPLLPLSEHGRQLLVRRHAEAELSSMRDRYAPQATIAALPGESVPRAIQRYAERRRALIVVLGSRATAPAGRAAISRRGRQLLNGGGFALAIAARGVARRSAPPLQRIGVGFDGGPESRRALALAVRLVRGDAELSLIAVVDNHLPLTFIDPEVVVGDWDAARAQTAARLREHGARAVSELGGTARVVTAVGDPAEELRRRSSELDLIVVGSRRWGAIARLVSGAVGETLVSDAGCSVVIVPRGPRASSRKADA